MKIRFAGREDMAQLLQLYRHLNPDDGEVTVEDGLRNLELLELYPGSHIVVGCLDAMIVATCTLVVIPNLTRGGAPYALVENVVTDPACRNRGYGKAVLRHAVEAAWEAGCYKVMLLTGSKQAAVLKFYHDAGFEQSKTGFQMRKLPPRAS